MRRRLFVFSSALAVVSAASLFDPRAGQAQTEAQFLVTFTEPARDNIRVGREMDAKGTASIPSGNHLWVLVHRVKGFANVWWPQGEAVVDPTTKEWDVHVVFGGTQDIGYEFEVAAITVNKQEHLKLQAYLENAQTSGNWPPIKMPPTTSAPVYRRVLKENHN
ncbi:MAG TPA: hypothetical protein VJQ56_14100 [Blastocatellia bacterium]|nr:hypothetical protein [Blastocatellia bacterium]